MSETVARWPANRKHAELEVRVATNPEETDALFRLRHEIYVEEIGLYPPDHPYVHDGRVFDPYDDWSTHLMLYVDGVLKGGIRFTERRENRLELDDFTPLARETPDPYRTAEITRFMIRRDVRGTFASSILMEAIWQVMSNAGCRYSRPV
jgi:N-acyl-L-homoserine lactone synthetase